MKTQHLLPLALLLLNACGGSGSDTAHTTPTPPADTNRNSINLSPITVAPLRAERPDAATQAQIDIAVAETNRLRSAAGRAPLIVDQSLAAYAAIRARESAILFEHQRLNGTSSVDPLYFSGYGTYGENLAAGDASPYRTVAEQWRSSPSHYQAIISPDFTHIGLGHHRANDRYRHYWTQIFATPHIYSIYRYTSPLTREQAQSAIQSAVQYHADGRISLNGRQHTFSDDTLSRSLSDFRSKPYVIAINRDHQLILRAPQHANWSYQTFGEIADSVGIPEAYINLGQPFIPAADATLQATYRGQAIGDLGQHSRTIADVNAHIQYGAEQKTLTLHLTNSQRGERDLENIEATALIRDPRLDFSDTLQWNSANGQFESTLGSARLYGPNAEELGGQYSRSASGEHQRGAYGAIRTP